MPGRALSALLLALLLGSSGCAWHRKAKPRAAMAAGPISVGSVALVDGPGRFALIDQGTLPAPPVGGLLKCYNGSVESANLVVTQVRKHPFTIADIRSGEPHKGDHVWLQPSGNPLASAPSGPAVGVADSGQGVPGRP